MLVENASNKCFETATCLVPTFDDQYKTRSHALKWRSWGEKDSWKDTLIDFDPYTKDVCIYGM